MAKVYVTQAASTGGSGGGNLQLLNGAAMDATLRAVADTANTASPLKLSTSGVQTTTKLQITTADTNYIDAEDNSGNNRFTVGRDPASQQVNVDFASNPGGSTELVGGFRTYVDGTNLSNVVNIRRDGQLQIGSTAASAMYWDNTNNRVGIGTATPGVKLDVHSGADNIAQLNRTGAGKSLLQYLLTGTARWSTGFDNTNGNYTIYDAVNATDRVVVSNTGRLGVGTNAPSNTTELQISNIAATLSSNANLYLSSSQTSAGIKFWASGGAFANMIQSTQGAGGASAYDLSLNPFGGNIMIGVGGARVGIQGTGSTSATTSLLVQNSGGTSALSIKDDLRADFNGFVVFNGNITTLSSFIVQGGVFGNNYQIDTTGATTLGAQATANASALLDIRSTTRGFLPPRMTNAQRLAIASPAVGLMVYCTDAVEGLYVYKSTGWTFVI